MIYDGGNDDDDDVSNELTFRNNLLLFSVLVVYFLGNTQISHYIETMMSMTVGASLRSWSYITVL